MRLEGGATPGQGDILIRNDDGLIAPICGTNWNLAGANVICKQLGYNDGAFAFTTLSSHLVLGNAYIFRYESCNGNETRIQDCEVNNDTSSCYYNYGANGAVCQGIALKFIPVAGSLCTGRVSWGVGNVIFGK